MRAIRRLLSTGLLELVAQSLTLYSLSDIVLSSPGHGTGRLVVHRCY